ncbi:hypothetical protein ACVOMT_14250 [Sphingomonas panni]
MGERSDGLLHRRLDMLEDRGRSALVAAARRDALVGALPVAAAAAIPVPALLVLLAFVTPLAVVPALSIAVLVPLIVLAAVACARIARLRADRGASLALIDGAAGMKDRAATTAEFLDAPRDPFRAAALAEAAPWLDRAAAVGISVQEATRPDIRRTLAMLAAALLLLIAAMLVRPAMTEASAGPVATTLRHVAVAIGLSRDAPTDAAARGGAAASGPNGALRNAAPAGPGGFRHDWRASRRIACGRGRRPCRRAGRIECRFQPVRGRCGIGVAVPGRVRCGRRGRIGRDGDRRRAAGARRCGGTCTG